MSTPITDAFIVNRPVEYDPVGFELKVPLDVRDFARRLELDRAALMEECQQLLNIVELTGPSFTASIRTAKEALSTARANFP